AERPIWNKPWVWAIAITVLFIVGWLLGGSQGERSPGEAGAVSRALRVVGLGGARFEAKVQSRPADAWIMVDGKDIARRTPASLELSPGTHQITLSFADLGGATFQVRGIRGEKVALEAPLWGSLAVYAGDGGIPVAITVDGIARGLAPVTVDSLSPGTHEVRFSGPGLQPWGQTVQVRVQETAQLVARAVTSPGTGVLEIRSLWTDAEGSEELAGATVYVDGEKRGVTPMTLELARGPHSVRIESRGERSPVQVIDLPGGNQRFANFELGLGIERPTLAVLGAPIRVPLDQPAVISAALQGLHAGEAREMWLHLRQPDGAWRRYPMVMMKAPGGIVGSTVFPNTLLDAQGRTPFYVSATNQTGDDYFSELLTAQGAPAGRR
ncbi:MAG: PEGA domain-containing protein, partial [Candidatus Eisenbacteria bacterium]